MTNNYKKIDYDKLEEEVQKAKKNNKESKEYIINMYMPFILKTIHSLTIPGLTKEDIKQELISSLLYSIEKYSGTNSFFWYAIQSMKNNIYGTLKKLKKQDIHTYTDNIEIDSHNDNIENIIIRKEESKHLLNTLKSLKKSDFDILYKTFFLDYSYNDLMKETNLKYSTLACKKSQALKKLKNQMESNEN